MFSGVCVPRASKERSVRLILMTVRIMTVRTTPPAWMELTTTLASVHLNIQVTHAHTHTPFSIS